MTIPAKIDLAYFGRMNPRIDVMANIQYNLSSAVREQCVRFANVANPNSGGAPDPVVQGPNCVQLNWRDAYTVSLGLNYHDGDRLTYRLGMQYDRTPVPSASYRSPALPDNNRILVGTGLRYQVRKGLAVDIAAAHLHIQDGGADYQTACNVTYTQGSAYLANNCTGNGGHFRGSYTGHANLVGLQVNQSL